MQKNIPAIFFDFDSTVITKEGLEEVIAYALSKAPDTERASILSEAERITNLGMEGKLAFTESVERRLGAIPLSKKQFEYVGECLVENITPRMKELFALLHANEHPVYIASGGFCELILPTAQILGVPKEHCFANQCIYDEQGAVTGVDTSLPTWTNEGKHPVLTFVRTRDTLEGPMIMIGDGASDQNAYTKGVADTFICFTENAHRASVAEQAPYVASSVDELTHILKTILDKIDSTK